MFSPRFTSLALGIIIAGAIIRIVRKDQLHAKYAVLWFFLALISLVFGAFPGINDWIGIQLGVHYPPILLVIVVLGLILIKILTMDIDRSSQEAKLRVLAERLAVLEGEKEREREQ